jgi:hypothetical protein
MSPRKPVRYVLQVGDVLETHPTEPYFGVALVLAVREATDGFDPMCLIGITTSVFTRPVELDELRIADLAILEFDREARTGPSSYAPLRRETCIGIYTRELAAPIRVLGRIDTSSLNLGPLGFDVGDGTGGRWPLCGPVSKSLGYEAVIAWRMVHDRPQFLAEREAARLSHEEMLLRLKKSGRKRAPKPGGSEAG